MKYDPGEKIIYAFDFHKWKSKEKILFTRNFDLIGLNL